jgi:hypothetical protein
MAFSMTFSLNVTKRGAGVLTPTGCVGTVLFLQSDFSISELLECVLAILKGRRYGTIGVSLPLEETQGAPRYEPISGNASEQLLFQKSLTIMNLTASPTPLTSRDSCPTTPPLCDI